jgi:hypothetical protein
LQSGAAISRIFHAPLDSSPHGLHGDFAAMDFYRLAAVGAFNRFHPWLRGKFIRE